MAACRRFTFVYGGHEYAWDSHDKFSGTDLSCVSTTTGDTVAFYTSKMWPRKLQGELVVEAQVGQTAKLLRLVDTHPTMDMCSFQLCSSSSPI